MYLDAFARAWEAGAPPPLAEFLKLVPLGIRRVVLTELVKIDLENRLQRGLDRPLEDYFCEFPELTSPCPPPDLLYEDYHLRQRAGRGTDAADYFRRFPTVATELARLLGTTVSTRSTSALAARSPAGIAPGERLDDFDLLALLGEGQFAKVFLARQVSMQRLVALKVSARRGAEAQHSRSSNTRTSSASTTSGCWLAPTSSLCT